MFFLPKFIQIEKQDLVNFQRNFLFGNEDSIATHFLEKSKSKNKVILPCSLNDVIFYFTERYHRYYKVVDIFTPDGMPLVVWFKIFKKINTDRVYGPDLMVQLIKQDTKGVHFFFGASEVTLRRLEKKLTKFKSKEQHFYFLSPSKYPWSKNKDDKYLKIMRKVRPDYIWIGISSPLQVKMAVELKKKLNVTALFCVGAAFDLVSGAKPQAPRIIRQFGFEWLFRLLVEPRRLWKRYLVVIPLGLFYILKKGIILNSSRK